MPEIRDIISDRHPGTQHFAALFEYEHLPMALRATSKACHDLAVEMIMTLNDGPELTTGLRKLREAKDCLVTQRLLDLGRGRR